MKTNNRVWRLIKSLQGYVLIALALICLNGCGTNLLTYYFGDTFGGGSDTIEKTPDQLAWEGIQSMEKKDYGDALKAFQTLKEHYPYSKYAILAELKVGDAYFRKKEYADAALAYEEFIRLHPRNEVVPYVLYQMGMCYFLSFKSIDRDPEQTQMAIDTFNRLIQAFPDSKYSHEAKKQLFECKKRLAAHDYYVARIYYRLKQYKATMIRLDDLTDKYPLAVEELGYQKDIDKMREHCGVCLNENPEQKSLWSRVGF